MVLAAAAAAAVLALGSPAEAGHTSDSLAGSIVPTGRQEYVVLGNEQHVWRMMERVRLGQIPIATGFGNGMNSVVSAVASADAQVVTYDQWEDGYEADILAPVQASTLVLGDANTANGRACDWTSDPRVAPCDGTSDDVLFQGTALTFNSNQGLACTTIRCSVPLAMPGAVRSAADIRFDGGDRLVTSGGPLSLIHNQDPLSPFIGGSTEVLPRQAFAGATSYYVPAGEDEYPGTLNAFRIFHFVAVNIAAFDDDTQVFVNSPGTGGGTVSFTLNRGQHYTNCLSWDATSFKCSGGAIDGVAAPSLQINTATKISTTKPVAILLLTGGDGNWATDFFPILPDLLHGNDYILASAGDDPAIPATSPSRPLNIFAYNPDSASSITVTATDSLGTNTTTLAANGVFDYRNRFGRNVPANSTVRLTADRSFWGLAVHDYLGTASDWGYSWLATKFLTNSYTVSFAPGVNNLPTSATPAQRLALGGWAGGTTSPGDPQCTIPPPGPGQCNSINRAPVYVAATLDGTLVKVDFDNDGFFDYIDTDSDDYPENGVANDGTCATPAAPWNVPGLTNCLYSLDALQVLRVYDYTDYDNTGTRVQATKPVAMSYGQDTDQATGPDPVLDTGYTVYPLIQRFLDPVLVVGKTAAPDVVSGLTGGQVTFTITLQSYAFAPLASVAVWDVLPLGLSQAEYVPGSTRVTYPDLSQDTADPTFSVVSGRTRMDWAVPPSFTMGADQTLTVSFTMNVPPGATTLFSNEARGRATHDGRVYNAVGGADVVRTPVSLTKLATDDASPQPGDVVTYTFPLANNGATPETGVTITDAIPAGTTFLAGTITTTGGGFSGAFSAGQNAVVWTSASFAAGASATLSFQVRINVGTAPGTVVANRGLYDSAQTPRTFSSNETLTTVVGPNLVQTKTLVGGIPAALHPLELATFEIQVRNAGAGTATSLRVTDALAFSNATYTTGTMRYSVNGAAFVALTDAADADEGTLAGTTVELLLPSLAPSADVRFRFQARVDAGTGGRAMNNQATVSATEIGTADTNLVQVPIVGNATVTGRVFRDVNANGSTTIDPGEPGLPDVTVRLTDSQGITQTVVTDAGGTFTAVVPAGATAVDVDDADPDLPAGSVLSTANDPQSVAAVAGSSVAAPNVGYRIRPLTIVKSAIPAASVLPGQTITYTVTVRNNSAVTQTGLSLSDAVPTGTSYVAGSASVSYGTPTLRATEYYIPPGAFTGTTYSLTLSLPLAANYFVILEGSDGSGGTQTDTTPSQDLVALTDDPTGAGDLGIAAANSLRLTRRASLDSWVGVVKVVECLADCATAGFVLRDVQRVSHDNATTSGSDTSAVAWSNINQVMLIGGQNGAGCDSTDGNENDHKNCHVRLWPSGTNTINWTRDTGGSQSMTTATSTVMVVEWGSEWTVQRRQITGNNGGTNVDALDEYNSVAINPVSRASTWVWGTGHTDDGSGGESADGVILTLGNGVTQNATESFISAGANYDRLNISFDAYALSHPSLRVSHGWLPSAGQTGLTATVAPVTETVGNRIALVYNSLEGSNNQYSRPLLSARYASPIALELERRRANTEFAAWAQGIDFSGFLTTSNLTCGNDAATCNDPAFAGGTIVASGQGPGGGYAIPPAGALVFTYRVVVEDPPPTGLTSVANTATASTTQNPTPISASATTPLLVPAVDVEPNNAGYANAGRTITFTHDVTNRGNQTDAFALAVTGERGWRVDLVDPDTGVVIATDLAADGTWDSGTLSPSTGGLAPGASKEFKVGVWVPAGATAGIEDTVRLRATSGLAATVWDDAKDEITVLPPSTSGSVIITPDNSGVVRAGSYTAYAHRVINNTAIADTFDLRSPLGSPTGVDSSQGWTNTIHWDTNGDGVYTPAADLQIVNTAQLPPGGSQLIFVVVNAPAGTASGTRDVSHLTAWSRNDPTLFGAATDTSTVVTTPRHDLSGGGTRVVAPGDTAVYPGTIVNLGPTSERFELTITASNLFGPEGDGLAHPTELWVDTDGDGVPDQQLAIDATGDGTWDLPLPLVARLARGLPLVLNGDSDGDGLPDVAVPGGGALAYELRRAIDLNQKIQRDHVTLSSRSVDNPTTDPDNVTATWIFAAATRAGIQGLRVDAGGIAFATSTQSRTLSFVLYQTDDPTGATGREALHAHPVVSPVPDSITPILYTVPTRPVEKRFVMIEETEVDGDTVWTGPFAVGEARLERSLGKLERRLNAAGVPEGPARWLKGHRRPAAAPAASGSPATAAEPPLRDGRTRPGVKIEVTGGGPVRIAAADLEPFGLPEAGPRVPLRLTNLGRPVAFSWERRPDGSLAVSFEAQPLRTDYSDRNVYLLTPGTPWREPPVPLTRSAEPETPGFQRVERDQLYIPSLPAGVDPWQWDFLFSGAPWPDPGYDPQAGDFDLPYLGRIVSGPVPVRLRLVGYTNHRHSVTASINGAPVGSVTFDGAGPALLTGTVAAQSLRFRGNRLSIAYSGSVLPDSPPSEAFAYLDYVDVAVPRSITARPVPFTLAPWRPLLPALDGVDYLVVTHPLFRAQADRIAAEKAKAGHVAAVVETTTAYDRFSGGVVEPRAIQALVRLAARASGVLRYVLLVGDDSFDPLDLSGRGVPSFVPSLFTRDSGWGLVPSENLYADLDDDGRPDLAIGRLPVRTPAQADAVADKIAGQDAALVALGDAHLAVADNSTETDAPFRDDAQDAVARLPEGSSVRWADLAQGPAAARAALLAGWESGVAGTHYFGHGGLTEWADEQVLTTDDVATLGSGWRPTVLFTWACLSQYYLGVDGPSLNESLVLQPGGGALASFGPAGITPPARQAPLVARVYDELRTPGIGLGEAIRRAKAAALAEQPGSREVIEGFHLFGDPALVLHPSAPTPQ